MEIKRIPVGINSTNCYLVAINNHGLIIDPGGEESKIINKADRLGVNIEKIIITHGHFDHIAGLAQIKKTTDADIYIHHQDARALTDPEANLSSLFAKEVIAVPADELLHDGDIISLGDNEKLKVIHTPGHSPGGIVLYHSEEGVLFSGDTIFAMGVGRTDFPGADRKILERSIKDKLLVLPEETTVLPGHGPRTTLENFRKNFWES